MRRVQFKLAEAGRAVAPRSCCGLSLTCDTIQYNRKLGHASDLTCLLCYPTHASPASQHSAAPIGKPSLESLYLSASSFSSNFLLAKLDRERKEQCYVSKGRGRTASTPHIFHRWQSSLMSLASGRRVMSQRQGSEQLRLLIYFIAGRIVLCL
jgi:hypothetical protein